MDRRISSSIDNNIPARHYQLFGVPDLAEQLRCSVIRQQHAWLNIPVVDGDSEPSPPYSMALAEELGCRLYGVLSQISQAELDIFHGRYYSHQDHDDHHDHQPPTITDVVNTTTSQETAAAPQVPKEEEREKAEEENTAAAAMKEDDEEEVLEEEEEKEEEMIAYYYKTDQKLHEQLLRKHYYPKYSRKSCRSSRKRSRSI